MKFVKIFIISFPLAVIMFILEKVLGLPFWIAFLIVVMGGVTLTFIPPIDRWIEGRKR